MHRRRAERERRHAILGEDQMRTLAHDYALGPSVRVLDLAPAPYASAPGTEAEVDPYIITHRQR
jgi:hypothetical protein